MAANSRRKRQRTPKSVVTIDGIPCVSSAEAAVWLGLSPSRIREFLAADRLEGVRYLTGAMIPMASLASLDRRPVGRPRREPRG